jgi:hypothetical protein
MKESDATPMEVIAAARRAPREPQFPILMHRSEVTSLKEAAYRTGKSEKTLKSWCRQFGIGRQSSSGAPIEISAPALEMVLHGDTSALELLRDGDRHHPRVKRYFDHLGIPIEDLLQ